MKKMLKAMMLIMSFSLVLAGCTDKGSKNPTDGATNTGGPTNLSMFVIQKAGVTGFDNNELTTKLEKKLNIKFKFEVTPEEGAFDKQQILFASGDYPASFLAGQFNQSDQLKFGKEGLIIPLNDLIDKYAPNIKKAFADKPYYLAGVTAPDGNIYSLPALEECYHCQFYDKFWINKKWLDHLKLDMPKTTAEMEKVLLAFQNDDPNGNGKKDEVAMGGGGVTRRDAAPVGFFMNAFIYDNEVDYLTLNGGKVDFAPNKPQWREGLRYLHNLYKQGLIDSNSFTQDIQGLQVTGDHPGEAILGSFPASVGAEGVTLESNHWTDYVAVPPLKGPDGVQLAAHTVGDIFYGTFAVTNKATKEQQIAAIKVADYFFSEEGALDQFFGVEGKGWFKAKPGEKGIDGNPAKFSGSEPKDGVEINYAWGGMLYYMPSEMFNAWASSQDTTKPEGYEAFLFQTNKLYEGYQPKESYPPGVWLSPEDSQTAAQIQVDLVSYVQQKQIRFITGLDNIETDWDSYIKDFEKYKVDEYLKIKQKAYDNIKK